MQRTNSPKSRGIDRFLLGGFTFSRWIVHLIFDPNLLLVPLRIATMMSEHIVYADYGGCGTTSDQRVPTLANPHSHHTAGERSAEAIAAARRSVLEMLHGSEANDLIFTSGTTGSLRLLASSFPFDADATFVCHWAAHTSLLGIRGEALARGATFVPWKAAKDAASDLDTLIAAITECRSTRILVGFPAECNFSGERFPVPQITSLLSSVALAQGREIFTVVDAAALFGKVKIELPTWKADFVAFSFYKAYGGPTGVGALVVRRDKQAILKKRYFGGGTVAAIAFDDPTFSPSREEFHAAFEDGTPNFQSIAQLLSLLGQGQPLFQDAEKLTTMLSANLRGLKHDNGTEVVRIHSRHQRTDSTVQGPTLAVTVRRSNGSVVGHSLVERLAELHGIYVRSGCFCNAGACQFYLQLTAKDVRQNFEAHGKRCGDDNDVIDGRATGAVRISIGRATTEADIKRIVLFFQRAFVDCESTPSWVAQSANLPSASREIIVTSLFVFPIKGVGGIQVTTWPVNSQGFLHDRQWLIAADEDLTVLSPKRCAAMSELRVILNRSTGTLYVTHPRNGESLAIAIDDEGEGWQPEGKMTRSTTLRNRKVPAVLGYPKEVQEWLSKALDRKVQLLKADKVSLANNGHFLVVSENSHQRVLSRAPLAARRFITMRNYRPNIVVRIGTRLEDDAPFRENEWKELLGTARDGSTVRLSSVGECQRCQIVGIGEDKILRPDALQTISALTHERNVEGAVMGQLFDVKRIDRSDRPQHAFSFSLNEVVGAMVVAGVIGAAAQRWLPATSATIIGISLGLTVLLTGEPKDKCTSHYHLSIGDILRES